MKFSIFYVLVSLNILKAWNPFSFLSVRKILSKRENNSKRENLSKLPPIKEISPEKRKAWYIIGKSAEFEIDKPYSVVLQEKKYVVWKDSTERFYALENQCSHKGAALSDGIIDQGCIVCPYHFSYFSKDGSLGLGNTILKESSRDVSRDITRKNTSISSFPIISQNDWIYLYQRRFESAPQTGASFKSVTGNLVEELSAERIEFFNGINPDLDPDIESRDSIPIYNTSTLTFQETEIETDYQCSAEIIAEKMLDIVHYYQDPNPGPNDLIILQQPRWISSKRTNLSKSSLEDHGKDDSRAHGQTIYQFRSGIRPISENIFVQKAGRTFFTVESEFVLPYTFITKIRTGEDTLKIISCISPISKKKCRVYTKIHRNFGKNWLGEWLVRSFVRTFLEKDREILEKIDVEDWKQREKRKSRYYYRQEKMIRFYRQAFDAWI